MISLGPEDHGRSVAAHIGDEFEVRLVERPTAGFRWRATSKGEPVCRIVEETRGPGAAVGGESVHRWRLRAATLGAAELRFRYSRAFGGEAASKELAIRVVVSESGVS